MSPEHSGRRCQIRSLGLSPPPHHFTPVPLPPFCSSTLAPLPAQLHFFLLLLCSSLLPPDLSALLHLGSIHFPLPPRTRSALCAALDGSRLLHNVIRGHATSCATTFRTQSLISVGGDQSFFHRKAKEKKATPTPESRTRICLVRLIAAGTLRPPARAHSPQSILRGAFRLGRVSAVAFDPSSPYKQSGLCQRSLRSSRDPRIRIRTSVAFSHRGSASYTTATLIEW